MKSIAEMQTTKKSAMSLVMLTAALLLGRQQEAEGGDGVVRERPPMLGDAIGLRSRGAPTNPTSSSSFPIIIIVQICRLAVWGSWETCSQLAFSTGGDGF